MKSSPQMSDHEFAAERERREAEQWLREEQRAQHELMAQIEEERFLAIMDKKPEIRDGVTFLDEDILIPPLLVEPFFPSGGLALFHGKRGLGKTMMGMGLAHSVATGTPFLDTFPARKGVVVYMQLDMNDNVFQERLRQAGDFYRLEDLFILTGVASVARASENDRWVQDVVALQPDLIIIDTLRKAHSWEENSSDTPARFYAKLRELFGWTSVFLIHHDKKDSEFGRQSEQFRGSGAWIDDVDVGIQLIQKSNNLELHFSKVRVCEPIEPFRVQIDPERLCLSRVRAGPGVKAKEGVTAAEHALSLLQAHNNQLSQQDLYEMLLDAGWSKAASSKGAKRAMKQAEPITVPYSPS